MKFYLQQSNRPEKRFVVTYLNPSTNRFRNIHFGDKNYENYTISKDEERKRLYRIRHQDDNIDDLSSAGAWSWGLLWNKPTLLESIKDMEQKFGITIKSY